MPRIPQATVIGTLIKDPGGDERYTKFELELFEERQIVTVFTRDSALISRMHYHNGDRIRAVGRPNWNEFGGQTSLQIGQCKIDIDDEKDGLKLDDELKIKLEGTIAHQLEVEKDDKNEGGGRFIRVQLDVPDRGQDSTKAWVDLILSVQVMVLDGCVDKLLELDKKINQEGKANFCFSGYLDANPQWVDGTPCFYMEATDVIESETRSGDGFWEARPKGLANRRKAASAAVPSRTVAKSPPRGPSSSSSDLDDSLPF